MNNEYWDINFPLFESCGIPYRIMQGYMINNGLANSCFNFNPCNDYLLEGELNHLLFNEGKTKVDKERIIITLNEDVTDGDIAQLKYILHLLFVRIKHVAYENNTITIDYNSVFDDEK